MDYYYWKPVLCAILFTAVISVNGRPAEKNIESLEGTDGVQIPPDASDTEESENASKNDMAGAFKKLLYNVSYGGLHAVRGRFINDQPEHYVKDLLRKSRAHYDSQSLATNQPRTTAVSEHRPQTSSVWRDNDDATTMTHRRERNSKHRNLTNVPPFVVHGDGNGKENIEHYIFANVDELQAMANEPVSDDLKSINRTKNPFAFLVTSPEYAQRVNGSTKKKVPVLLQLFAPTKNEYNDTIIERIDNKYLVPILEKLKLIANREKPTKAPPKIDHNLLPSPSTPSLVVRPSKPSALDEYHPFKKIVPHQHHNYYQNIDPYPLHGSGSYDMLPVPFYNYPPIQYHPYDYYRFWASPFSGGYLPPVFPQDPYHFRDDIDYINYRSSHDICQHYRIARNIKENEENKATATAAAAAAAEDDDDDDDDDDEKHKTELQTEANFEDGKRRYDDSPIIEYIDHVRSKRDYQSKKEEFRVARPSIFGNKFKKEEPPSENKNRAADVGPQISKLIVRRGGVAIAGAGGIATAGSGGTAIVGPGGTAYTTPASSGGVAMVGPGGKVVNLPDFPSVLYGRTAASVAATGAGHTTFTNRRGEVFTTNDNTGGVALVNPGGNIVGVSDDEYLENENHISATNDAKEVHLPAGARLLTTGPIIYYNPVYPTNHSRIEHKASEDDAPIKSLPYYGGAKEEVDEDVGMEEEEGGSDESESNSNTNSTSGGGGGGGGGSNGPDESVCVGSPPDNASVAEAKPVGLAVAGPGGVAASKPVGTAISGPGGLSVARPVATAIAGVPGAEGLIGLPGKKKYDRPLKSTIPALIPVNKTKEERAFASKLDGDDVKFEYSNSIPAGRRVFYIPVYLPEDYNPQQ